jgi:RNA polymerase primary sigma factor/RNA polymerase sigma factor
VGAERKLLDNAVDRTNVQYDSWMDEETSFWMDRNHTNSNLQYRLLMQNLQELETSLAGKDLKMLENDIFVRIEQLGALRSFTASMTRVSVKVNPPRLRKSRKASSSQFISEWKSHPRRRRSIVREQSALLETIKVLYYVKQNSYLYW